MGPAGGRQADGNSSGGLLLDVEAVLNLGWLVGCFGVLVVGWCFWVKSSL